uniref:PDZ domain-containing protein n=1 Tax=Panagrellus redivivus TaxID=6233 RepID=A0A7E4WAR3_PANRE
MDGCPPSSSSRKPTPTELSPSTTTTNPTQSRSPMRLFKTSTNSTSTSSASKAASSSAPSKASVSSFLSKHYDAIYVSTEDESSGPYAPSTSATKTHLSKCKDHIPVIVAAPIRAQYPQSALSARIRQFASGTAPPGATKRDSGDSELSVRFADQIDVLAPPQRRRHRVGFKSTTSEGGDSKSSSSDRGATAKSTVSCPPMPNANCIDKFDYDSYVKYIVKLTGDWTQIQVVHLPNDPSAGLGFGIVGGASTGVVVKTILPGSAADKDQRLRTGDRILQIGRINVQGMSSQQVAGLLRQPEPIVELIVGRPINVTDTPADSMSCWTMATRAALNPTTLEEQIQHRIAAMQNGKLPPTSDVPPSTATTIDADMCNTTQASNGHVQPGTSKTGKPDDDDQNNAQTSTTPAETHERAASVDGKRSDSNHSRDSKTKSCTSTERPMSLKNLQEMALTTFCRENWVEGQYEEVNVELRRDSQTGLGITVAGYVHKKEEISGVFVKSLVPNSAAHLSGKIRVHDLIIDVNGHTLENLTHSQSVRTLVKSGNRVRLKMIRFALDSPQAVCLKMLHEQETDTQIVDVQSTLLDYKHHWQTKLGTDFEVISVIIRPDRHKEDGGLGISFEGTVDIVDGTQLCPHHYVESLRKEGPAAKCGLLKAGDELLQVNDQILYGESHVTVRQALGKAAAVADLKDVRLILCRKAQQVNLYMPSPEQSLPLAYTLLASDGQDRIVKAKSESALNLCKTDMGFFLKEVTKRLRSRSLEHLSGLAIWNCVPIVVSLEKDSRGLGFSIIDYRDPVRPSESVIVIRSLVPGGVAQADGRIVPGDRLLFVNSVDLSNSTLDHAVAVLKAAPAGLVRLGIAKPVPVDQLKFNTHSPIISRSERLLAKGTSPRTLRRRRHGKLNAGISGASSQEEVWIGADVYRHLNPQLYFPSSGSASPSTPRVSFIGFCFSFGVTYITAADARLWKQRFHREAEQDLGPVVNRLSPKVFPKFYKSPYLGRRSNGDPSSTQLFSDSSFDEDDSMAQRHLLHSEATATPSEAGPSEPIPEHPPNSPPPTILETAPEVDNDVRQAAERIGRQNAAYIIDGVYLEEYVHDLVQAALADSLLELAVAHHTPDWRQHHDQNVGDTGVSASVATMDDHDGEGLPSPPPPELLQGHIDDIGGEASTSSVAVPSVEVETPSDSSESMSTDDVINPPGGSKTPEPTHEFRHVETPPIVVSQHTESAKPDEPTSNKTSGSESPAPRRRKNNFWGEARTVLLDRKPPETFGISIVGGRVEVSQKGGLPGTGNTVTGIFIKSVLPESPAGRSGKMFMGDRVISVNDVDLRDATHEHAVQVIKAAKNPVKFVVQSLQSFSVHQQPRSSPSPSPIAASETETPLPPPPAPAIPIIAQAPPIPEKRVHMAEAEKHEEKAAPTPPATPVASAVPPPTTTETPKSPTQSHHESVGAMSSSDSTKGRHLSKLRESIRKRLDKESAAALPRELDDPEEEDRFCYTSAKIKAKYGDLPGEPILIRLENIPPRGLGLSLAGNRDRDKTSVFVVDIQSTSPLPLHVGDELLEINGKVLFGLSHVTATSKIRESCDGDELALLILRRTDAAEDIAHGQKKPEAPETTEPIVIPVADETTPKSEGASSPLAPPAAITPTITTTPTPVTPTTPTPGNSAEAPTTTQQRKKSHQMERGNPIETGKETLIEIDKNGKGLGLSIVGGSDTVLGTVVIHEVYSDGAAAHDGRLKPGDQVLEVNGFSLRSVSHEQAISILRRTASKVRMLVYRDVNLQLSLLDPTQIYNIFNLELTKKPGRGLGISIVGRKNEPGVYVSEIVKGGVAEQDGRLLQGDQILAVNGQDVATSMQEDVATMLKTCAGKVTLKIGRWKLTETANRVHAAQPPSVSPQMHRGIPTNNGFGEGHGGPTPTTPRATTASNRIENENIPDTSLPSPPENGVLREVPPPAPPSWPAGAVPEVTIQDDNQGPVHADLSPVTEEPGSQHDLKSLAESGTSADQPSTSTAPPPSPSPIQLRDITINENWHEEGSDDVLLTLKKAEGQQWGMGIGKRQRGILITSLQPGSTAAEKLKVGDRIMGVNGEQVTDQHSAVTLVKASGNCVVLQIARPARQMPANI